MEFKGFTPDSYRFLTELGFENSKPFFEANRERYVEGVQKPMRALCAALAPTVLHIDPALNCNPATVVSRIYRDARRTGGRAPYRDNAWLSFRRASKAVSETFCLYFEIELTGYGYGMGSWGSNPELLASMRARMLADPAGFLSLAQALEARGFVATGEAYKRDHFPTAPAPLRPYLNQRGLSWCYFNADLSRTMDGNALFQEVNEAFWAMEGLYCFLVGSRNS